MTIVKMLVLDVNQFHVRYQLTYMFISHRHCPRITYMLPVLGVSGILDPSFSMDQTLLALMNQLVFLCPACEMNHLKAYHL